MAARKRIRRKLRQKTPAVHRRGAAPQLKGPETSDLIIGGAMDPVEKAADRMAARALAGPAPIAAPAAGGAATQATRTLGARAFAHGHALGVRADGVSTVARPTGSHTRPAAENVSDQICNNARGNANVTGGSGSGRCCRDLT